MRKISENTSLRSDDGSEMMAHCSWSKSNINGAASCQPLVIKKTTTFVNSIGNI